MPSRSRLLKVEKSREVDMGKIIRDEILKQAEADAQKLYDAGAFDTDIAKCVGMSSGWVFNWRHRNGLKSNYRKIYPYRLKKPRPIVVSKEIIIEKKPFNPDWISENFEKCRKCKFSGRLGDGVVCCEYILHTGLIRGCSAKDCTHNTDKKIKRYAEVF